MEIIIRSAEDYNHIQEVIRHGSEQELPSKEHSISPILVFDSVGSSFIPGSFMRLVRRLDHKLGNVGGIITYKSHDTCTVGR